MPALHTAVARAVAGAFAAPELAAFEALDDRSGATVARYYRARAGVEQEVAVYRDKWWSNEGGSVSAELYCLVPEVQRAVTGHEQQWLNPNLDRPLLVFQYRTDPGAEDVVWPVTSVETAEAFGERLLDFLCHTALGWFEHFVDNASLDNYLTARQRHHERVCLFACRKEPAAAEAALRAYLLDLPRGNEQALDRLVSLAVLDADDRAQLLKASLQTQEGYAARVEAWLSARHERSEP